MGMRLIIGLALLALGGCGGTSETGKTEKRVAFTVADSWYAPPPSSSVFLALDKDRYASVIDTLQLEAQTALADVPVKSIRADEATCLVGHPLPAGAAYVLLRAVVLYEGTGTFSVGVSGTSVSVHHGCLGRRPTSMSRKALVAVLATVRETVYASCSMAE